MQNLLISSNIARFRIFLRLIHLYQLFIYKTQALSQLRQVFNIFQNKLTKIKPDKVKKLNKVSISFMQLRLQIFFKKKTSSKAMINSTKFYINKVFLCSKYYLNEYLYKYHIINQQTIKKKQKLVVEKYY